VLSVIFTLTNQSYAKSDWTGNANFALGKKYVGSSLGDNQNQFGLNVDFGKISWPLHIAFGYLGSSGSYSEGDASGMDTSTSELRIGVNKIWETAPNKPPYFYLGGGLAMIQAEGVQLDGQSTGGYINGGIFWTIAKHFNLGVDLGYSKATVHTSENDIGDEAGGGHALFFIGYHW
jgi:hypothetical protein